MQGLLQLPFQFLELLDGALELGLVRGTDATSNPLHTYPVEQRLGRKCTATNLSIDIEFVSHACSAV